MLLAKRGIVSSAGALATILATEAGASVPAGVTAAAAGAAFAGGTAPIGGLALIQLMNMTKIAAGVAGLIISLSIGAAIYFGLQERAQKQEINALLARIEAITHANEVQLSEMKATLAKSDRARLVSERRPSNRARRLSSAVPGKDSVNVIHISEVMRAHPEFRALNEKNIRRGIMRQYGDMFARLDLSPEKLAQLKNLMVQQELSVEDASQVGEAAGLPFGSSALAQAMQQARNDVQQQIVALLGMDQSSFEKIQRVSELENSVTQNYQPDFVDAGLALTSDQSHGLAQILYALHTSTNAVGHNQSDQQVDPNTWLSPVDQQVLTASGQVLSPAQIGILKSHISETNQQEAIMSPFYKNGPGPTVIDEQ